VVPPSAARRATKRREGKNRAAPVGMKEESKQNRERWQRSQHGIKNEESEERGKML